MSPLLHELIVFTGTLGLVFLAYFVLCRGSVPKERSVSGSVREDNPEFPEQTYCYWLKLDNTTIGVNNRELFDWLSLEYNDQNQSNSRH